MVAVKVSNVPLAVKPEPEKVGSGTAVPPNTTAMVEPAVLTELKKVAVPEGPVAPVAPATPAVPWRRLPQLRRSPRQARPHQ